MNQELGIKKQNQLVLIILGLAILFLTLPIYVKAAVGNDCAVPCGAGLYCRQDPGFGNDSCESLIGLGSVCDESAECRSQNCVNGRCELDAIFNQNQQQQQQQQQQNEADAGAAGGAAQPQGAQPRGGGGGFRLPELIPAACRIGATTTQQCGLPELVQVGINLAKIILALSGSLALLMFIYGGFTWLTAAGSSERVDKGKKILTGAVIGLIIIFGAVTIINFAQQALTGGG